MIEKLFIVAPFAACLVVGAGFVYLFRIEIIGLFVRIFALFLELKFAFRKKKAKLRERKLKN